MNEQAIKKLRRKFIRMQTLTLVVVMLLMSGLIYFVNVLVSYNSLHEVSGYIIQHKGIIQDAEVVYDAERGIDKTDDSEFTDIQDKYSILVFLQEVFGTKEYDLSAEKYSFSTRYFYVEFNEDGNMSKIIKNHIAQLSGEDAEELGRHAVKSVFTFGQLGNFYYSVDEKADGSISVLYLESTSQLHQNTRLMFISLMLVAVGVVITLLVVMSVSRKAIAPEIRAAELQKRFITDASHELKTPLAVIKANTEMQEIIGGENEWTQSTLRQVDRMNGLIKELVTISKQSEREKSQLADTDISAIVKETAETFSPVARCGGIELEFDIPSDIHLLCSGDDIRQLVSLLLDNAIKYCDENGTVKAELSGKNKKAMLKVSNDYKEGANVDYDRFFERFYREDKSRNIDKGGYGIGLSIAQEIVKSYRGSIDVSWNNGVISFVCMLR